MNKHNLKKFNWPVIFLMFFFISEAIYKYLYRNGYEEIRISGVVKLLAQILMVVGILLTFKKNRIVIFKLFFIFLMFISGQLLLKNNINFVNNFEYFNNSIFIILTFTFFYSFDLSINRKLFLFKFYEYIILFNSIFLIIGFLFSINYFETYSGNRFGYSGFLMKSSLASYFYSIAFFYYTVKHFVRKSGNILFWILILFSTILTGTKLSLLSVFITLIYLIITNKIYLRKEFYLIFISVIILARFFSRDLLNLFLNNSETFAPIIRDKGIFSAITSFRSDILLESTIPYISENWGLFNYMFGGMGDIMLKSGFELIDLFYFFGIIGGLVYSYTFYYVCFKGSHNREVIWLAIILICMSFLGGNFFYNSSIAIYLFIVINNLMIDFEK